MRLLLLTIMLLTMLPQAYAFHWHDLWVTKDQQAKTFMDAGQFTQAQDTFEDPAWQATAAFRAGHYKDAATHYQSLKNNPDAWYNLGNALAHDGQLEPAIQAYDKALSLNHDNQDALYNRTLVSELLKKEKEQQKQDQNKQDQNKQDQGKQDQNKQDQNKQDQDKQDQDKQDQDKQDQDKQDQDKQDQDKQDHDKQDHDKQDHDKQDHDKQDKSPEKHPKTQNEREQQQAKEQWLRLIPDDPSGLIREKFLQDYLSRHRPFQ